MQPKFQQAKSILIALVTGVILGSVLNYLFNTLPAASTSWMQIYLLDGVFSVGGEIFITSLKSLAVPLILVSVMNGVANTQSQNHLISKVFGLYLATTLFAILLGLTLASLFQLGQGVTYSATAGESLRTESLSWQALILRMLPLNPLQAMLDYNMVAIVILALFLGYALNKCTTLKPKAVNLLNDLQSFLFQLLNIIIRFSAYGVFCLIVPVFAKQGLALFSSLTLYIIVSLLALVLHVLIMAFIQLKTFAKLPVLPFFKKMRPVMLFAFATDSSSATLPLTLKTLEQQLGIQKRITSITAPIGSVINMDGGAIFQSIAIVFIANAYMIDLTLADYLLSIVVITLATMGTASVPGMGIVTLILVLEQLGLPPAGIGLLLAVDRFLGMVRTAVNITIDGIVSCLIAKKENALDNAVYSETVNS